MNTVTLEIRGNALVLPPEVIAQLGWREDTKLFFKRENGNFLICPQELHEEQVPLKIALET